MSVIGFAGPLLDDNPFRAARSSGNLRVHIIFPIASAREPALSILKHTAADISRERFALMLPDRLHQVFGLLWGLLRDSMQLLIERWRAIVKS